MFILKCQKCETYINSKYIGYHCDSLMKIEGVAIDCNDCVHCSITEDEQNEHFKRYREKPDHRCNKLGVRLLHLDQHPRLYHHNIQLEIKYGSRCSKFISRKGNK